MKMSKNIRNTIAQTAMAPTMIGNSEDRPPSFGTGLTVGCVVVGDVGSVLSKKYNK